MGNKQDTNSPKENLQELINLIKDEGLTQILAIDYTQG